MTRDELRRAYPKGARVKPTSEFYRAFRVKLSGDWPRGEVVGHRRGDLIWVLRDGKRRRRCTTSSSGR